MGSARYVLFRGSFMKKDRLMGTDGTKWENHHFRTYILNTLPTMSRSPLFSRGRARLIGFLPEQSLAPQARAPPLSLDPLFEAADNVGDNGAIRLFVNSYARIVDQARFGKREPTETDAAACEKVMEVVLLTWVGSCHSCGVS